jgi:hypothetical protein
MTRTFAPPIAALLGALVGVGVLALSGALVTTPHALQAAPQVILAANSSISIPAFTSATGANLTGCLPAGPPCGKAGVSQFEFNLTAPARINGSFSSSSPLQMVFTSGVQIENAQCDFSVPACHGDVRAGSGFALYLPGPAVQDQAMSFNLTSVSWNFTNPANVLPSGEWVVYILNWNDSTVTLTAVDSLTAS